MSRPDRRRAERRAHLLLEQKYRQIFEESPDSITINEWKSGRYVEVNHSFERVTGYAAAEVIGRTPRDLAPLFVVPDVEALIADLQRDGIVRDRELTLRTRSGATSICLCTISLIDLDGAPHAITMARDVTLQRRAERALHDSDTLLRMSLAAARMGTWSRSFDDDSYLWSPEAARIYGLPLEEMPRSTAESLALIHPEDRQRLEALIGGGEADQGRYAITMRVRHASGTWLWVEARGQTVVDAQGRRWRFGVFSDVSDRRAADLAQRASHERFARLFEGLPMYAMISRLSDGRIAEVNPAFEQLTGWTREEAVGRTSVELGLVDAAVRAEVRAQAERRGALQGYELRVRRRDGEWLDTILDLVRLDTDGEAHVAGILRDVTGQKRAERALRDSERRFAALFQGTPNASLLIRLEDQVILDANAAYERERGIARRDLVGRQLPSLTQWRDLGRSSEFYARLAREGAVRDVEAEMNLPDGTVRIVLLDGITLELDGETCALLVSRDITERKQAELEVRRLNAELEQRVAARTRELEVANRELEAFSYSVAHDLRAPLRAIAGFSALLTDARAGVTEAERRQHLQRIAENAERMSQMIDALLALSRLMRIAPRRLRVPVSELARVIADELAAGAAQRQVDILIADGIEVDGDPRLLRVLLENLLGNAWKYTAKNAAARIELGAQPAEGGMRTLWVRDDGVGFDPVYAGRLFGLFQRLHGENEFPGHGVGLSTVKRIVEVHGGRVWAESAPGLGATFYVELPAPAG